MTLYIPVEVVIAGMTILITMDLDEAIAKCKDVPGAQLRTALGRF
ncbi:MAG: hypothetical protein VW715_13530 [Rhodospirillales bacterium]